MSILSLLASIADIIDKLIDAYRAYQDKQAGRNEVLEALRQKRDADKGKADAITHTTPPPDDTTLLNKL